MGPIGIPPQLKPLLEAFSQDPDVALAAGWGAGNAVLKYQGKIFVLAMGTQLVFKLPRRRVDELVESSGGTHFDPRRDGRRMKEWVVMRPRPGRCLALAGESYQFVATTKRADNEAGR
jgi:hypothetical protein